MSKAGRNTHRLRPRSAAALAFLAFPALAGVACRTEAPAPAASPAAKVVPPLVEAVRAKSGALPLRERVNGVVRARNQVEIRAEVSARVVEVLVRSGETVTRGQPLVRMNGELLRQELQQAEAGVRLANASELAARARVAELKAQLAATQKLADQAMASALELETHRAQLAVADASVAQARARIDEQRAMVEQRRRSLDRVLVRAPVAGRVGRRNAEVGMMTSPDTVLFVIGDLDRLIVEVPLNEKALALVSEGDVVEVGSATLGGRVLEARLSRISPFLSTINFTTVGEIDLANEGGRLRPGMQVTVDIVYGNSDEATLVPTSALWEDPDTGITGVYLVSPPDEAGAEAPAAGGAAPAGRPSAEAPLRKTETAGSEPDPGFGSEPVPVIWRPIQVLAEGGHMAGVRGVRAGQWVVNVGQHLIDRGGKDSRARVRPALWSQVIELQSLQREDLLDAFLEKQQRLARVLGARPPDNADFVKGKTQDGGGGRPVKQP